VAGAAAAALAAGALLVRTWPVSPVAPPAAELGLRQFTHGSGLQQDPAWSPTGDRIAFASDRSGNLDIWIQGINDGEAVPVTQSPSRDTQPAWSPDGQWLAFQSERGEESGIYVIEARGRNERRVASFGAKPSWSPRGDRILFASSTPDSAAAVKFYTVSPLGGTPELVVKGPLQGFSTAAAAWTPDGHVSLWGRRPSGPWALAILSSDGEAVTYAGIPDDKQARLAAGDLALTNFAWAPNGRFLYFEGRSELVRNIWRVPVDPRTKDWTGWPERLTTGAGTDTALSVSADGRRLAFGIITGPSDSIRQKASCSMPASRSPRATRKRAAMPGPTAAGWCT
jgi:Tol biopolymer transport system component